MAFLVACQSSSSNAPEAIKESFQADFPEVKESTWEQQEDGNTWLGNFETPKGKFEVLYAPNGGLIYAKREIANVRDIPSGVNNEFTRVFTGYEVDHAYEINTPRGTLHELHVHFETEHLILRYDSNLKLTIEYPETEPNP